MIRFWIIVFCFFLGWKFISDNWIHPPQATREQLIWHQLTCPQDMWVICSTEQ